MKNMLPHLFFAYYQSPLGLIEIGGHHSAVTSLNFVQDPRDGASTCDYLQEARAQVRDYFEKKRQTFDLHIDPQGTPFQTLVWKQLMEIPYGITTSYGAMAQTIGRPNAQRAVGAANGRNPISVIIPCHRLVGSNQRLTGYGGGLWRKAWLLEHEGAGIFRS